MGKRLVLTEAQLRKIPGHSTKKTPDQLRGMVAGLLTELNLDYALVKKDGSDMVMIEMQLNTDELDVKRVVHIKLEVPEIYQKMKKSGPKHLPAAGWRFFYDYLKSRLASVQLGITDLVEEFTANIVLMLPDGSSTTIAEAVRLEAAKPGSNLLPFILEADQ